MRCSLLSALGLCGCVLVPGPRRNEPPDVVDNPDSPRACLAVPRALDLGVVELDVAAESTGVLGLANPCERDLEIYRIELDDPEQPFVVDFVGSPLLAPGRTTELQITYAPAAVGRHVANLLIESNDSEEPVVSVTLTGVARGSRLALSPAEIDVGAPLVGCRVDATFALTNLGADDLEVEDAGLLSASPEAFVFDGRFADSAGTLVLPPLVLGPGRRLSAVVGYMPTDTYEDQAFLRIATSDADVPEYVAEIDGTGTTWRVVADEVEQSDPPSDRFPLSEEPVPATIVVHVDGVTASGWHWAPASNAVVFVDGSVPASGAQVEIRFDALPTDCG